MTAATPAASRAAPPAHSARAEHEDKGGDRGGGPSAGGEKVAEPPEDEIRLAPASPRAARSTSDESSACASRKVAA